MAGPVRPSRSGRRLPRVIGLLGLALLLGVSVPAVPATAAPGPGAASPLLSPGCTGAGLATSYTGSLVVDGGGTSPPGVANRTVSVSYWATLNFTPKGQPSSYSCKLESATATTDGLGGFSIGLPLPTSTCNSLSCSLYSGPYGPARFSLIGGDPPGYFLTQSLSGRQAGLALVNALATTRLVPGARVTLSTDAPTLVHAYPLAGNGAASPATNGFAWRIAGSGWTILNGSSAANVSIEAFPGAGLGTLTAWVNGTYNGTALAAPPATLDLAAATTSTSGTAESATAIDVGYPVTLTVTGEGAGGYPYWANFTPGLNASPVQGMCTGTVVAGGLLDLACSASVTYAHPGTAGPTVLLTNGFSGATDSLLPITVAPALDFGVSATNFTAYTRASVPITVTADPSAGTAPRGPACVWPGDGRLLCEDGPGPSYPFSVAYGSPGRYGGHATLADAAGGNASVPFAVAVFDRPQLQGLSTSTNILEVGGNASLVGVITGGALPIDFWWNSSQPAGTLYAGTAASDGPLVLTYLPRVATLTTITLTVVDALGTSLFVATSMNVSAGPVDGLRVEGPSNGTASAGAGVQVTWTAVDPGGETVGDWAPGGWVTVVDAGSGAAITSGLSVNLSAGPAILGPNGTFPVPPAAWVRGALRASISVDRVGQYAVRLDGAIPGGAAAASALRIVPNFDRLALRDARVVTPGPWTNATLWRVLDVYGNPVPGGGINVATEVGGVTSVREDPILGNATGGTFVWVNYSVPSGVAATIRVLTLSGAAILPPIYLVAGVGGATVPVAWLAVALVAAGASGAAVGLWRRRRPEAPDGPIGPAEPAGEEELARWAEGRAHVLGRASTERGETLDELALGFVGRPPRPEEMTEWVASLVADGSLRTVLGDDGRSRFLKVHEAEGPPRLTLDDRALSEAIRRREALEADGDDGRDR